MAVDAPAEQQPRQLRPGTQRDRLPVVDVHADDFEACKQQVARDLMEARPPRWTAAPCTAALRCP